MDARKSIDDERRIPSSGFRFRLVKPCFSLLLFEVLHGSVELAYQFNLQELDLAPCLRKHGVEVLALAEALYIRSNRLQGAVARVMQHDSGTPPGKKLYFPNFKP